MGLFGGSTQIGVNIGTSSIKIAELKKSAKTYTLEHFGVVQLPEDAIVNREIVGHMAVVDAMKNLVSELKIKGKSVITSLSGAGVIVKKILLDQVPAKELDDAIMWEAEQYIPFDMNEITYDFQVTNKSGDQGKMEIMLVACKKSIIESYRSVLLDAGLNTHCVDVDLFALQNTFEVNYPVDMKSTDMKSTDTPTPLLVDIGASSMKLVVVHNGQPIFSRDAALGGKNLTADVQRQMNLSYQEAEILKIDGNLQGQMPQELADLVGVCVENFTAEIKRSIDFFIASNAGVNIAYILLSGGSSRLVNLQKHVEESCMLPTQILNPFNQIKTNPKYFNEETLNAILGISAIPIGLAIRGFLK